MDFLASINIPSLPEQQTRLSRSEVQSTLSSNPDVRLGFDACCACGRALHRTDRHKTSQDTKKQCRQSIVDIVRCKRCRRIAYCSKKCRDEDAWGGRSRSRPFEGDNGESDSEMEATGHSAVVCSLLRLCNDDDKVDERYDISSKTRGTKEKGNLGQCAHVGNNSDEDGGYEAAEDRVRSEYESYPATLANILTDGPCYKTVVEIAVRKKRSLIIHVIGSSDSAEIWNAGMCGLGNFCDAYTEALSELAESNLLIDMISIVFVGPECRKLDKESRLIVRRKRNDGGDCRVTFEAYRSNYESGSWRDEAPFPPDVVIFFNPGFTCQDYCWANPLKAVTASKVAFLVTTNTEMEAMLDCQYLHEQGWMKAVPKVVAEMIASESGTACGYVAPTAQNDVAFLGENPFSGSRVRQSGNMANDLFVKNHWMFGGFLDPRMDVKAQSSPQRKRLNNDKFDDDDEENDLREKRKKKKRLVVGARKNKKRNAALI